MDAVQKIEALAASYDPRPQRVSAPLVGKPQSEACRASFDKFRKSLRKNMQTVVKHTLGYPRIPRVGSDANFDAGVFLWCAVSQTGPRTGPISRVTGISHRQCALWGVKARELGILCRTGVFADPWHDPADPLAAALNFCLDACTLTGTFVRIGDRNDENALFALPSMVRS